jgi:hypothetical protein
MSLRTGLDTVARRKFQLLPGNRTPILQPVAWLFYSLSYRRSPSVCVIFKNIFVKIKGLTITYIAQGNIFLLII